MYVIRMKNCAFFARHGVLDEEEALGQRFYVDAELTVEPSRPLEDDSIEDTVNYGIAFTVIEKIVTGHRRFLIDAPLERRGPRIRLGPVTGRAAATEVDERERFGRATLLEVRPRTGRTHQIRVHLSAIGHPVLGDRTYGGGGEDARKLGLGRPFLHSWRVSFGHPVTGRPVRVEDPLPPDLEEAIRRLGPGAGPRGEGRPGPAAPTGGE